MSLIRMCLTDCQLGADGCAQLATLSELRFLDISGWLRHFCQTLERESNGLLMCHIGTDNQFGYNRDMDAVPVLTNLKNLKFLKIRS